jgi:hypothetical protein
VLNDSKKNIKGWRYLHSSHGLHTNCQSVLVTTTTDLVHLMAVSSPMDGALDEHE